MKDFIKYTLATITGLILSGILLFIITTATLIGMVASTADQEVIIKDSSVLTLRLDGILSEKATENPFKELLSPNETIIGLDEILLAIKKAKEEDNIKGIYLEAGNLSSSFASLETIRNALLDFKQSGKFIISYSDQYSQGLYYVATAADEIHVNPQGGVLWAGLAAQPLFYTDLLKKVGVDMQIFKVGTYKSAVEPYTETHMSSANKEQVSVFLNDIWSHIVKSVSESRHITEESLQNYADQVMLFQPAETYIEYKLVDYLSYKSELDDILKAKLEGVNPNFISFSKMKNIPSNKVKGIKDNIAIYYAEGGIVDSGNKYTTEIVGNKMVKDLKKLEEDDDIKAVVLRVNSPGGSAYASEQIWKAVMDLKAKKPVVVSMGDYAASGGYYISAAADCIVADNTTLTGSIGIFAMIPNFEKLKNKIGLHSDVVKTNKHADFGSLLRAFTTEERQILQSYIESGYELFIKRCADGRSMSVEEIKKIAEGRVWTGARAKTLGLVDRIGGIDTAISIAAEKADLKNYKLKTYPRKQSFMEQLLELTSPEQLKFHFSNKVIQGIYKETKMIEQISSESYLQARLPYILNIQ